MTEQEPSFILCSPTTNPCYVASERYRCCVCDTEVWVSDPMTPLVRSGAAQPVCIKQSCQEVLIEKYGPPEMGLHENQRPQLRALGLEEFAEEVMEDINQTRKKVTDE